MRHKHSRKRPRRGVLQVKDAPEHSCMGFDANLTCGIRVIGHVP